MAIPAPTNTVVGGPLTMTEADPSPTVACTDTADPYTPVATSRVWQVNGTDITGATDVDDTLELCGVGTFPVAVEVTNGDGTAAGTEVNVVVSDGYTAPAFEADWGSRIHPEKLPSAYQDAQLATPGIPDPQSIANAELYGSVLLAADQVNVIAGGIGQNVTL